MKIKRFTSLLATAILGLATAMTFSACGGGSGSSDKNGGSFSAPDDGYGDNGGQLASLLNGKTFEGAGRMQDGDSISVRVTFPSNFSICTCDSCREDGDTFYVAEGGYVTVSVGDRTYSGSAEFEYEVLSGMNEVSIYLSDTGKEIEVDFNVTPDGAVQGYGYISVYDVYGEDGEREGLLTDCYLH